MRTGELPSVHVSLQHRGCFSRKILKIVEIMNNLATCIFCDEKAAVAIDLMENREKPFIVLPVIDRDHKSVGMIHLHDLVVRGL